MNLISWHQPNNLINHHGWVDQNIEHSKKIESQEKLGIVFLWEDHFVYGQGIQYCKEKELDANDDNLGVSIEVDEHCWVVDYKVAIFDLVSENLL